VRNATSINPGEKTGPFDKGKAVIACTTARCEIEPEPFYQVVQTMGAAEKAKRKTHASGLVGLERECNKKNARFRNRKKFKSNTREKDQGGAINDHTSLQGERPISPLEPRVLVKNGTRARSDKGKDSKKSGRICLREKCGARCIWAMRGNDRGREVCSRDRAGNSDQPGYEACNYRKGYQAKLILRSKPLQGALPASEMWDRTPSQKRHKEGTI